MWKVDQIMANAERETEKGYKIYSYYIRQLQDSEVTYTAEYEEYKQKLVEMFLGASNGTA